MCKTVIHNDFSQLTMMIDDVKFEGYSFTDLEIINTNKISQEKIKLFQLLEFDKRKYLSNCAFEFKIPQILINLATQQKITYDLQIFYELGNVQTNNGLDKEQLTITIKLPNLPKITSQDSYFEDVFNDLIKQINQLSDNNYQFQNCFGCQFSDYSIYGNDSFGTLMCFIANKDKYILVKNKTDYELFMQEIDNACDIVQEIYCCPHFQPRQKGSGYRG